MKKTRIIVPGMAVIAFSTAAAIAGSVAWFTASRTVTIHAGTYAVVKTTTNLDVELDDGCGTSASEDTITFSGKLTDGSFDHTAGNVYAPDTSGRQIVRETSIVGQSKSDLEAEGALLRATIGTGSSAVKVYTAATFGITFKLDFGNGDVENMSNVGLFFNKADSSLTRSDTSFEIKTATGFRIAFYGVSAPDDGVSETANRVYAGFQTSGNCKYVTSLTDSTDEDKDTIPEVSSPYDGDLVDSAYNTALPESGALTKAQAQQRADYLGTFKPAAGIVELEFTAVVWFEGTDPNVENQEELAYYETVTAANLAFDAIDLHA